MTLLVLVANSVIIVSNVGMLDFNQEQVAYSNPIDGFRAEIERRGLGSPNIIPDGQIHRFSTVTDKGSNKSGWFIFFADDNPCPAGAFGAWNTSEEFSWNAGGNSLTDFEREKIQARLAFARAKREQEQAQRAAISLKQSFEQWSNAAAATNDNVYLRKKKIAARPDLRQQGDILIIPMTDIHGQFKSIQYIFPDGKKRFKRDLPLKKACNIIDGNQETIFVAEGYATASSINQVTGNMAVAVFAANNIEAVVEDLVSIYKKSTIIIAADNDIWSKKSDGTPLNAGIEAAKNAAKKFKIDYVYPVFINTETKPTDFNDLVILEGAETARKQLLAKRPEITDILAWESHLAYIGEPLKRDWLVRGVFPIGQGAMLAAEGGLGKSFSLLEMCRAVAAKEQPIQRFFGGDLEQKGAAVYVAAEDDKIEIHSRLAVLGGVVPRLFAVPMPSVGGNQTFFKGVAGDFLATEHWHRLVSQLEKIHDLKVLVLDPLQPICALDLNIPEAGQFVASRLNELASRLEIAVIVAHHFKKANVSSPAEARQAVRGSTGIVDGLRSVFAEWNAPKDIKSKANKIAPGDVVCGAVIKGNGEKLTSTVVSVRNKQGLLVDISTQLIDIKENVASLKEMLVAAIETAAIEGLPYSATGMNGVYKRRGEMCKELCRLPRKDIENLIEILKEEGRIVLCASQKSGLTKWLDVPGGIFATGSGSFELGSLSEIVKKS